MQPDFPIAQVAQGYQRKAELDNKTKLEQEQMLNQSIGAIGTIGQSLLDQKKRVAQALALGRTLGVDENLSRTLEPQQVIEAAKIQKGMIDPSFLQRVPGSVPAQPATPVAPAIPAAIPPAIQPGAASLINHNADLASTAATIPAPPPTAPPVMPFGGASTPTATAPASMPVPISAPPLKPKMINPATFNAMVKLGVIPPPDQKVVTQDAALANGSEPKGTRILPNEKTDTSTPGSAGYLKNQEKLEQQYTQLKAKALSNRSGGLGLEDAKVDQAIHLRRLVNQFYDPKTGQYNIPKSQYGELTNGLATLISPGGKPGIEVIHELQQRTAKGDLGGALAYMGVTDDQGNVPTGSTQSTLKMLVGSIDRQGEQAEQNRQGYFDYIHGQAPSDLEPTRIAKHDKQGLNSFSDFLTKAPDRLAASASPMSYSDTQKEKRYQEWKARQK